MRELINVREEFSFRLSHLLYICQVKSNLFYATVIKITCIHNN